MKRLYRITKIWLAGKYKYLKRVNRWMRGQLVRDLLALTPQVIANMQRKYGNWEGSKGIVALREEKGPVPYTSGPVTKEELDSIFDKERSK